MSAAELFTVVELAQLLVQDREINSLKLTNSIRLGLDTFSNGIFLLGFGELQNKAAIFKSQAFEEYSHNSIETPQIYHF
jgi:hypothetical protein